LHSRKLEVQHMAMIVYLRYENIYMSCGTQVCSNMPDQTAHVEVMFMVNTLLYMAPVNINQVVWDTTGKLCYCWQ